MTTHIPNPFKPSKFQIFSMLVTKVTSLLNHTLTVKQVKQVHGLILVNGLNYLEPMLITQVTTTSSKHSQDTIRYVKSLVNQVEHPDIVSRTSVIQFLYQCGEFKQALDEYISMQRLGVLVCSSAVAYAIKACIKLKNRIGGIMLHGQVHGYGLCGDVHVGTALVGFYSKFNDMETVQKVFDEMHERNVAYVIDRYLDSGNLSMAERVFSNMGNRDIASWNSMLSWYTSTGDMEKAISTFGPMPVKTSGSWTAMISGYLDDGNLEIARNFYDVMPEENLISCIKMIDGYSKDKDVESAREIFDEMSEKNTLLYNAMINCYAQNGRTKDAFQLFDKMLQPKINIKPDHMTLATIISICSQSGNLIFGSWIHETLMIEMRITMDDHLATALIDLYAKCGRFDKAGRLFRGLQKKDVDVYTTMILACSKNGWKNDVIKLFEEMIVANICPNLVTFSGLLTALNHGSMVQESYHDPCNPSSPSNLPT